MKSQKHAFPWPAIMSVGLGVLSLSPRDLWSMSVVEFGCALSALYGSNTAAAPLTRNDLDALLQRFPDRS